MSSQVSGASAPVWHDPVRQRRLGAGLLASAGAYLAAAATMSLVFVSGPPSRLVGNVAELEQGFALYRWGFLGASLLAPALVAVLVLLMTVARVPAHSARRWLGTILLAAYVPFATLAYSTQYMVLPRLVATDPEAAALWYLHDVDSIAYAVDLTGYALLGLAAIVLASTLLAHGRLLRWVAAWLVAMGVLSLAAMGFHAAGATTAASVSTVSSALCTLPVMLLAMMAGRRLRTTVGVVDTAPSPGRAPGAPKRTGA